MAVLLEGGCLVTALREGEPVQEGSLRQWTHIGRASGAQAISLRVLEFAPGVSPGLTSSTADDVLYVLAGQGTAYLDGHAVALEPETGLYLAPRVTLTIDNPGPTPLVLVSSRCPDPGEGLGVTAPRATPAAADVGWKPPLIRLRDRKAVPTADRWYRVLINEDVGSENVTQFIGSIPPGRAPDHYHHYEEVLCILMGEGRMWAGATSTPVAPGSCIFLPRKQVHCLENTGTGELRLLGVFYPAGSPAVRYDPTEQGEAAS